MSFCKKGDFSLFMDIKGAKTLEQVTILHNEAIAKNTKTVKFEDMEKDERVKKLVNTAFDYRETGKIDKVDECFENALKINPNSIFALLEYGTVFAYRRNFKAAIEKWKNALKIDSNCASAYYNIGMAFMHLGRGDIGIRYYGKALNADIAHKFAYEEFTEAYNKFSSLYCKANELGSDLLQQATVCIENHDFEKSLDFLGILLCFEPNKKAHLLYEKISSLYKNETDKLELEKSKFDDLLKETKIILDSPDNIS